MTTTSISLSADVIKNKLLSSKGQFVKAAWKSNPKPAAAHKNTVLEKHTVAVVQAGVNYANLSSVKQGIADGTRGEVQELPWGTWKSFPYIIEHKDQEYLRLYPSGAANHIPKSVFFVDGEVVDKKKFAEYLTPAEAKKLLEPTEEDRPACFTIKADNILNIPEDVVEDEVKDTPAPAPVKSDEQIFEVEVFAVGQDCGDGSYSVTLYKNEEIAKREVCDNNDIEDVEDFDWDDDPYQNGYAGSATLEFKLVNGKLELLNDSAFIDNFG